MINEIHKYLFDPARGWDPIPPEHVAWYADMGWKTQDRKVVERLERLSGPLAGKRILDLGGGPGQYSVLFAQHGANVYWHDISRQYMGYAVARARAANVEVRFSLGYLEDVSKVFREPFDIVFNRVCWYYCVNEKRFAQLLVRLLRPGGVGYVRTDIHRPHLRVNVWRRTQQWLNTHTAIRIGHPFPPRGRVVGLLAKEALSNCQVSWSDEGFEEVMFVRGKDEQ